MKCDRCAGEAKIHFTDRLTRENCSELHLCPACAPAHPQDGPAPPWVEALRRAPPERRDGGVRFEVGRVMRSEVHAQQLLSLYEVGGTRSFSLVIGSFEAWALDHGLKRLPWPRPLTYDAWAATIAALGARVHDVFLSELRDQTYYAQLRLRRPSDGRPEATAVTAEPSQPWARPAPYDLLVVDVRPSDAVNVAVHVGADIYVSEAVLFEVCPS
jgi:bifunctional DNase/RNase